jgi:hypothetical protein
MKIFPFEKIHTYSTMVKIQHVTYKHDFKLNNKLQKNQRKIPFYEKIKIITKGPTILRSFVIVGLFDHNLTKKVVKMKDYV